MQNLQVFPFVGPYNKSRSLELDAEDTVNLYIIKTPDKPDSFAPLPGIQLAFPLESGTNGARDNGAYSSGQGFKYAYYALKDSIYRMDKSQATTLLANRIITTDGLISWANNVNVVAIVDGTNLYYNNFTDNLVQTVSLIKGAGFPSSPIMIFYQSARFFLIFQDSNQIFYSDFNDITSWNSLNYFLMNSLGDICNGISGINQRCFIFGYNITEVWEPVTYAANAPLIRDNNFNYEFGLGARGSLVKGVLDSIKGAPVQSFLYWLTSHKEGIGSFVISNGGVPVKVSTDAVDLLLRTFTKPYECVSIIYKEAGHFFIENSWTTDNITLVYDVNTQEWTRKSEINDDRSRLNGHIYFNYKHYVTSILDSFIYYLDDDYLTNNDVAMVKTRVTDSLKDPTGKRIRMNYFEVNFESGVLPEANVTDDGPMIPYAFLSTSFDEGRTFNNPRRAEIGRIGQYKYKASWFTLGIDYSFTFKIQVFDPVRVYIFGAYGDWEVMNE